MSTEQTKKDIDNWMSTQMRQKRYEALAQLAKDAGLEYEFAYLPALHVKNMDYDRWWMNVLAMGKIREKRLERLGDRELLPKVPISTELAEKYISEKKKELGME